MTDDRCPPHYFQQGWKDNDHGAIWCRLCGEVRDLIVPELGPPQEESLKSITVTDKETRGS